MNPDDRAALEKAVTDWRPTSPEQKWRDAVNTFPPGISWEQHEELEDRLRQYQRDNPSKALKALWEKTVSQMSPEEQAVLRPLLGL